MGPGALLACGAMNLDLLFRIAWVSVERAFGGALVRGAEAVLGDGGAEMAAWCERHGELLGRHPGGSAANMAVAAARLGLPVAFAGRVGDDEAGSFLVRSLEGVDASRVQRGGITGRCIILVDEEGERTILKLPGANELWEPPARVGLPPSGRWYAVHCTSLACADGPVRQRVLLDAVGPVRVVSLDPGEPYATRGREAIAPILSRVTHLFLNGRELRLLFGEPPDRSGLLAPPRRVVMVKRGAEGLVLEGDGGVVVVPPYLVDAVDATGAGDCAAAGYLATERLGLPLPSRGRFAAYCGALATTRPGRGGYPRVGTLNRFVSGGC